MSVEELLRIEPCESRGNYVLDIRVGGKLEPLHVGYASVLEKMQALIAAAIRTARDEAYLECIDLCESAMAGDLCPDAVAAAIRGRVGKS